jgi:putative tricarboxylic transport membrane protein
MLSFFVSNILMVLTGLLAGKAIYKTVLKIPTRVLAPGILLLTIVGSYSIRGNVMDITVMLVSGVAGFVLRELDFNPAPIVLGLILGPIAEKGLVQGLLMGRMVSTTAPWIIFFTRPICIALIILSLVSALWPLFRERFEKRISVNQEVSS